MTPKAFSHSLAVVMARGEILDKGLVTAYAADLEDEAHSDSGSQTGEMRCLCLNILCNRASEKSPHWETRANTGAECQSRMAEQVLPKDEGSERTERESVQLRIQPRRMCLWDYKRQTRRSVRSSLIANTNSQRKSQQSPNALMEAQRREDSGG
jgi:hypothetical protein